MLKTERSSLFSFFLGCSGYVVPRPINDNIKISKTMHSYVLGKRSVYYFYNLEKSLYGIRATLEVLENLIGQGGDILFVSYSPILKNVFYNSNSLNYIKWKRGGLSKFKEVDLVFLNDIGKENLVEAHRKCLLLVGVGSPTTSGTSYLFNLNIDNTFLAYWFFNAVYTASRRGMRGKLKKKSSFHSFLGKGCFNV
jgi:hypothetical protein